MASNLTDDAKKQKQIAFLAPHVERAAVLLKFGLPSIRYWRFVDEADRCEAELKRCHALLIEAPDNVSPTKEAKEQLQKSIKSAFESIDEMGDFMMYLFADALSTPNHRLVDNDFREEVDWAQQAYAARVQKAVDARHRHAPGFDGQGGGVSRRSANAE